MKKSSHHLISMEQVGAKKKEKGQMGHDEQKEEVNDAPRGRRKSLIWRIVSAGCVFVIGASGYLIAFKPFHGRLPLADRSGAIEDYLPQHVYIDCTKEKFAGFLKKLLVGKTLREVYDDLGKIGPQTIQPSQFGDKCVVYAKKFMNGLVENDEWSSILGNNDRDLESKYGDLGKLLQRAFKVARFVEHEHNFEMPFSSEFEKLIERVLVPAFAEQRSMDEMDESNAEYRLWLAQGISPDYVEKKKNYLRVKNDFISVEFDWEKYQKMNDALADLQKVGKEILEGYPDNGVTEEGRGFVESDLKPID